MNTNQNNNQQSQETSTGTNQKNGTQKYANDASIKTNKVETKIETVTEKRTGVGQERTDLDHPHEYKNPVGDKTEEVEKLNGEIETDEEVDSVDQDSDDSEQDSDKGESHKH